MQSHDDAQHYSEPFKKMFPVRPFEADEVESRMDTVKAKAERMLAAKESVITAGAPGEAVLAEETHNRVCVRKLPDDPLDVLRISVGEAVGIGDSAYCVIRGDKLAALELLRRAVRALERSSF